MKYLIIPDVHHRIKIAQSLIDSVPHDHVIHLGDHQDNFGDSVQDAIATAKWTRERVDAGDTIILGNHDLPYWFWNAKHDWGCGWTPDKHRAIQDIIPEPLRKRFKLWDVVDGWTLSHAGFTSMYSQLIPHHDIFMSETLWEKKTHPLIYHVGEARGGRGSWENGGGIIWLDWDDLQMSTVPSQIVGHTPHAKPKFDSKKQLHCLDTHLRHYGILEDGKLSAHDVES